MLAADGKPDYTALTFGPPHTDRPYVVLNMVMSADGRVVVERTEHGLGSSTDQRLMRELRYHADVVFSGAETMRTSGSSSRLRDATLEAERTASGRTRNPHAATITRSGNVPIEMAFFTAADFDATVYLADDAPPEAQARLRTTRRPVVLVPAADALRAMLRHQRHALGARLALCEGGPTVNGQLFAQGLVDEFFLTIGPVVVSGEGALTPVRARMVPTVATLPHLELLSAYANPGTSEVYLRYRVLPAGGAAIGSAGGSAIDASADSAGR